MPTAVSEWLSERECYTTVTSTYRTERMISSADWAWLEICERQRSYPYRALCFQGPLLGARKWRDLVERKYLLYSIVLHVEPVAPCCCVVRLSVKYHTIYWSLIVASCEASTKYRARSIDIETYYLNWSISQLESTRLVSLDEEQQGFLVLSV